MRFVDLLVVLFPLWAVVGTAGALVWPDSLTPLRSAILPLLGVVMFGMGLTLTVREFLEVARRPLLIAGGAVLQFGIMPFAAWAVGRADDGAETFGELAVLVVVDRDGEQRRVALGEGVR